jgi:hypothetical protein
MTAETLVINADRDPAKRGIDEAKTFFANEFGLQFDEAGQLLHRPTDKQLDGLRTWRDDSCQGGLEMADEQSFYRKVTLAQALMPQKNDKGETTYLFGKGIAAEITLQGDVAGREKRVDTTPYRTHADFEIYAFDEADPPVGYDAFKHVFGGQEIFPSTKTKGLRDLPRDYLASTADKVNLGGVELFVPRVEAQFVDKLQKGNSSTETKLRGATDAALLAKAYALDDNEVHALIDKHVIEPELQVFDPAAQLRKLRKAARTFGTDAIANASVAIGPSITFRLADHGLDGARLVATDDIAAENALRSAANNVLARKHIVADAVLDRTTQKDDDGSYVLGFENDERHVFVGTDPADMTFEAFKDEYDSVMKEVAAKEKNGSLDGDARDNYQPMTKEDYEMMARSWKQFSRSRGYSEADITEYERWLELSGQKQGLPNAMNDPWRGRTLNVPGGWERLLYLRHVQHRALDDNKMLRPDVIDSYIKVKEERQQAVSNIYGYIGQTVVPGLRVELDESDDDEPW